jgi:hypothetical protein
VEFLIILGLMGFAAGGWLCWLLARPGFLWLMPSLALPPLLVYLLYAPLTAPWFECINRGVGERACIGTADALDPVWIMVVAGVFAAWFWIASAGTGACGYRRMIGSMALLAMLRFMLDS